MTANEIQPEQLLSEDQLREMVTKRVNEYIETSDFRGTIDSLNQKIGEISDTLKELENLKKSVASKLDKCQNSSEKLDTNVNEALKKASELLQKIQQRETTIDDIHQKISILYDTSNSLTVTTQESLSSCTEKLEKLKEESQNLEDSIKKYNTNYQELCAYHEEVFRDTTDDAGETIKKAKKTNFEEFLSILEDKNNELSELIKEKRESFDDLKHSLEKEIHSLLPDAGSAGLASSYQKSKTRYDAGWITIFYYLMFSLPLFGIVYFYLTIPDLQTLTWKSLVAKFFITFPLMWISFMGFSSIRLNRRLYEEYNHKQRVMELYHSFSNQIQTHGSPDALEILLSIMLLTVKDKPSSAMKEHDKNEHRALDRIYELFSSIINRFSQSSARPTT